MRVDVWDGARYRDWAGSEGGAGKILLADANGNEITITDNAAFTPGTSPVLPVGGVYQSMVDQVDAGDTGAVRMTARRAVMNAADFVRVTMMDAVAIRNTAVNDAYLTTQSGLTEQTLASFRRWKLYAISSHDQTLTMQVFTKNYAQFLNGGGYYDSYVSNRIVVAVTIPAGGNGVTLTSDDVTSSGNTRAGALTLLPDILIRVYASVSPTTGAVSIVMEGQT